MWLWCVQFCANLWGHTRHLHPPHTHTAPQEEGLRWGARDQVLSLLLGWLGTFWLRCQHHHVPDPMSAGHPACWRLGDTHTTPLGGVNPKIGGA